LGWTLSHEHVFTRFGKVTRDPDLDLADESLIAADLNAARSDGVETIVEVSTYDMDFSLARVIALSRTAGLRTVKSTGWYRSPTVDQALPSDDVKKLTDRLVADLESGFDGFHQRAGVLGEVGVTGSRPTRAEQRALSAAVAAASATGSGIVAHTDDEMNLRTVVALLATMGLPLTRLLIAHNRCTDPLELQIELAQQGAFLGFDQLGHPLRDQPVDVAKRVCELVDEGVGAQIVLSADVGRRSRLTAAGGSGYTRSVVELLTIVERQLNEETLSSLKGGAIGRFLSRAVA
jgi:predicted metal-dependent phosphotriesterase family hydrolase